MGRRDRKAALVARPAVVVLAVGWLLSGCGLVGGSKALLNAPEVLTVTSPLSSEGLIPSQFTCRGAGQSPPVYWSGAPSGTRSFALVVERPPLFVVPAARPA